MKRAIRRPVLLILLPMFLSLAAHASQGCINGWLLLPFVLADSAEAGVVRDTVQESASMENRSEVNVPLGDYRPFLPAARKRYMQQPRDTSLYSMYGELLDDDPDYSPKYPVWRLIVGEFAVNGVMWGMNRYLLNYDWARIGPETWKHNIKTGWEWDIDRFGINFIGHPYSGVLYYNVARTSGYNYMESLPFAFAGSLIWEYFGENSLPSYNDIINTPISGAALGEILYRLSSNILDDRTRGGERIWREIFAGIVNPVRGVNRLLQGQSWRVVPYEIYQKEPLNITVFAGIRTVNKEGKMDPSRGPSNPMLNIQLDYGNPFEMRKRKPFDLFKLRMDFNFGVGRKIADNITGYGVLAGKNYRKGDKAMLAGFFQYYDYWNSTTFELGTLGFGGGVITRVPRGKKNNVYSALHFAVVPMAGISNRYGPVLSEERDYAYGGGLQTSFESTATVGEWGRFTFLGYYYWIRDYVGIAENSFEGVIRPRFTVRVYKPLSIGAEYYCYFSDRYAPGLPDSHRITTEPKIFVHIFLEDPKRRGKYN